MTPFPVLFTLALITLSLSFSLIGMEEQPKNYAAIFPKKPLGKPVGSKHAKKEWDTATYPATTLCQQSFTIDQQELNLLRAIERKEMAAIRKYAQMVSHQSPSVTSLMHILLKQTKSKDYGPIQELLQQLGFQ